MVTNKEFKTQLEVRFKY